MPSSPRGVITVRGNQDLSRKIDDDIQAAIRYVHTVHAEAKDAKTAPGAADPPTSGWWVPKPKPDGETRAAQIGRAHV